jgi:ribosomal protein S18 acetylase RimI-like enzyme
LEHNPQVLQDGDTYVFAPSSSKEKMLGIWCAPNKHTYVALYDGKIAGTYVISNNQMDLGSHIANGSYMVSPAYAGKGIGRAMGEHSLAQARQLGYHAMQFNIVIKSNQRAVKLWKSIGFSIIGEIPDAFNHQQNGLTNAYIMYQKL